MRLDDTQPCHGFTDNARLIGLCHECARRPPRHAADDPAAEAYMLPPARQNDDGEWWCAERRSHGHRIVDLAQSAPPSDRGTGLQSFIRRGDA